MKHSTSTFPALLAALSVSLAMSDSALAQTAATAAARDAKGCTIDVSVSRSGTVELSNTANTVKCEVPASPASASAAAVRAPAASAAPAAPAPAAAAAPAPVAAANAPAPLDTEPGAARTDGSKDPREVYRDAMMQGAPGTSAANPAVSRRYKMMDKATYQATVLGGNPPVDTPPSK